jgi:LacI family transcriptional regulator
MRWEIEPLKPKSPHPVAKSGQPRRVAVRAAAPKKKRRAGPAHVALIVETSLAYGRGLLHGIGQYIRENGPWSVYLEQRSLYDPPPPWLKGWKGDGIISRASSPEMAKLIVDTGIPTVDLNEEVMGLGLPLIYNDHHLIGRMAAEHLLERGFTHFGYLGLEAMEWSRRRQQGFVTAATAKGFGCDVYQNPASSASARLDGAGQLPNRFAGLPRWEDELERVARWVIELPKPAGVMACNDFRAVQLLDACRRAGVAVPEQVAVIGVDNDVACELCNPPLTSVIPDAERIGYEAARMLDQLMKGQKPPFHEKYVPPRGMVTRQSTDVTAINDPIVAGAIHFIRRHACDGIGVDDVVDAAKVSRSVLQRRFRLLMKRSIHDVILNIRLERVKQLLIDTTLSLPDIADRTGFNHSEYLSMVFKQRTGQTVTAFRKSRDVKTVG